jgi:DNA-binding NarL/FixJ family response regulator
MAEARGISEISMKKPRILLVDDHQVVRRGVAGLIQDARPEWVLCGEASTGREAVAAAASLKPDVVVMDISMPDMNGLEATREILKNNPEVEVLILSMHESEQVVHDVLSAGARGYILKQDAGIDLITALEVIRRHKLFFTSTVSEVVLSGYLGRGLDKHADSPSSRLTARELQIVKLVSESKANKEVANILQISPKTVESHRAHIMEKLGLHSVTELVLYAVRNNIVEC